MSESKWSIKILFNSGVEKTYEPVIGEKKDLEDMENGVYKSMKEDLTCSLTIPLNGRVHFINVNHISDLSIEELGD